MIGPFGSAERLRHRPRMQGHRELLDQPGNFTSWFVPVVRMPYSGVADHHSRPGVGVRCREAAAPGASLAAQNIPGSVFATGHPLRTPPNARIGPHLLVTCRGQAQQVDRLPAAPSPPEKGSDRR